MITYTWIKNKDLISTSNTVIHRGDINTGVIEFIIPSSIEGIVIDDFPLLFRYTLPNGDTYIKEITDVELGYKAGFNKYTYEINQHMTGISGDVEFDLRFEQPSQDANAEEPDFRLFSNVARIHITPTSPFYTLKEE